MENESLDFFFFLRVKNLIYNVLFYFARDINCAPRYTVILIFLVVSSRYTWHHAMRTGCIFFSLIRGGTSRLVVHAGDLLVLVDVGSC